MANGNVRQCAKKLAEEAVEVSLAAIDGSDRKVVLESADLLYRLEDLLQARGIPLDRVTKELNERGRRSTKIAKAMKNKKNRRRRRY